MNADSLVNMSPVVNLSKNVTSFVATEHQTTSRNLIHYVTRVNFIFKTLRRASLKCVVINHIILDEMTWL